MKRIPYKRRRQRKTDYTARFKMLTGNLPRIVIRKTDKYIIAEAVKSMEAQDFVICNANSKELLKYGWPEKFSGSLKSIPAAYLTGILLSGKIKKKIKEKKFIIDIGLNRSTKGSRIYAVVAGLLHEGIEIPHKKEILPDDSRLSGRHIKKEISVEEIRNKIRE